MSSADDLAAALRMELGALRQREGLTVSRVRELAPSVLMLRAVADEQRSNPQVTLAAAAAEVLKCSARSLVYPYGLIVSRTLRVDDGLQLTLGGRREDLKKEIGKFGQATYERWETRAYEEFVALLTTVQKSPCVTRRDWRNDEMADAVMALVDDLRSAIDATSEHLAQLLAAYSFSAEPQRGQILDLILSHPMGPKARPGWSQPPGDLAAYIWRQWELDAPQTPIVAEQYSFEQAVRGRWASFFDRRGPFSDLAIYQDMLSGDAQLTIPTEYWSAKKALFEALALVIGMH